MKLIFYKTWIILILLIFTSCNRDNKIIIGKYKFIETSKIERMWLYLTSGINHFFVGCEIELNNDSSYVYKTCGNIIKGNWKVSNDSLFCFIKSNRWRNDSLDKFGFNGKWPKISDKPTIFKIDGKYLKQIISFSKKDKAIIIMKHEK
jgi:hypothetical protein